MHTREIVAKLEEYGRVAAEVLEPLGFTRVGGADRPMWDGPDGAFASVSWRILDGRPHWDFRLHYTCTHCGHDVSEQASFGTAEGLREAARRFARPFVGEGRR